MTRPGRPRRTASWLYRRAVRALSHAWPPGAEDEAVGVFDALQARAADRGARALFATWCAEGLALVGIWRATHRRPRGTAMTALRHDIRDAWRALRRSRSYAGVVILTLALGIGVNTAIFSVVDSLVLKSLPYSDPDRLVRAAEWPRDGGNFTVAPAAFIHWRDASASFMPLEASVGRRHVLVGAGPPETVRGAAVTTGYFALLGAEPALGRLFAPSDGAPDAPCRVVVSHALWVARFSADAGALGEDVRLSDTPCTLIGVLPAGSVFDRLAAAAYTPLVFTPEQAQSQGRQLTVLGRLSPGVSLEQARERLRGIAETFNATRGDAGRGWSSAITPWRDVVVRTDTTRLVWVLFGAVMLVLAIACANVAGLSLSRAMARRRELAIRGALGAGRWRLMRYLTIESLMLGLLGGAAGLAVGAWTLAAINGLTPPGLLPAEASVRLDWRTLAFTAGLAILTALLFGTLPAWQASRSAPAAALGSDGRTQSSSRSTTRLHAALVISEVAVAMVLIAGAVLFVTSFVRLGAVDPGFDPARVLTVRVDVPDTRYPSAVEAARFIEDAVAEVRRAPGVTQAAAVTSLPLGGWLWGAWFEVEGQPVDPERPSSAHIQHATDGYFETLGLEMLQGRGFESADRADTPLVAVVNETFVSRFLGRDRPLGQRLQIGVEPLGHPAGTAWEIVGVVRNVKTGGLDDAALATPEIYVPQSQSPLPRIFVAVRAAAGDPRALEAGLRDAIAAVDPEVPVDDVRTMHERIGGSVALERFRTTTISAFAVLAAFLAGFGIYAVRARAVASRRREMGIRLALGATRQSVLRLVLGQGLALAAAGVVLGLAGTAYLARVVEPWLFETQASDPLMILSAMAAVALPAVAASWLPARRAASVSPTETLRAE